MIRAVAGAILPAAEVRCTPAEHPYTTGGLQIDILVDGEWVEIGECGIALPALLDESGLDSRRWSGLALGLGLDRLLMLVKRIPDIRLLRSTDPRVTRQLIDLEPWRPVSNRPPIRRDLSVAVAADCTPEDIGDRVREAMRDALGMLESVEVLAETPGTALPAAAKRRIGMRPGQKNVLIRLVVRDLERTLTSDEANLLRDRVYAAVHEGDAWQWAARRA
jgi:phenylalanyl-tRNA synthetase alpha chain